MLWPVRSMSVMRSSNDLHGEEFEDHIEYELVESGYQKRKTDFTTRTSVRSPKTSSVSSRTLNRKQYEKLENQYGPQTEEKLLKRISDEIEKRGLIDVLRRGVKDRGSNFQLVYFEPKSGLNPEHRELYKQNRFTVVRQLKFLKEMNSPSTWDCS